jgi:hypothetical protein
VFEIVIEVSGGFTFSNFFSSVFQVLVELLPKRLSSPFPRLGDEEMDNERSANTDEDS